MDHGYSTLERQLLGTLLNFPRQLPRVAPRIAPDYFTDRRHRTIYSALAKERPESLPDLLLELERGEAILAAGGREYVLSLLDEPGSMQSSRIPALVDAMEKDYKRREAAGAVSDLAAEISKTNNPDIEAVAAEVSSRLTELRRLGSGQFPAVSASLDELLDLFDNPAVDPVLPTGFPQLDDVIGGLVPKSLITMAGATGGGKSSLASEVALQAGYIASKNPGRFGAPEGKVAPVLIYTWEMSREEVVLRMVAQARDVQRGWVRGKGWLASDKPLAEDGLRAIAELPIYVFDDVAPRPGDVRAHVERFIATEGVTPGLVVIDHIGLMSVPGLESHRTGEIEAIARAMKVMAQELATCVLALSQFSRDQLKEGRRPHLADLKHSGEVENSSNVVLLVYRPNMWDPDSDEKREQDRNGTPVEVIVAKNRFGEKTTVEMTWVGRRTLFVPKADYVPDGGRIDPSAMQGIIDYPDVSAVARIAPSATSTIGSSLRLTTDPVVRLAYENHPSPINARLVSRHCGVSESVARATLDAAVNEGLLHHEAVGQGPATRHAWKLTDAALAAQSIGDEPF